MKKSTNHVIKILIVLVVTFFLISCTDKKKENDQGQKSETDIIKEDVYMHHNHEEGRTHGQKVNDSNSSDTIKDINE